MQLNEVKIKDYNDDFVNKKKNWNDIQFKCDADHDDKLKYKQLFYHF